MYPPDLAHVDDIAKNYILSTLQAVNDETSISEYMVNTRKTLKRIFYTDNTPFVASHVVPIVNIENEDDAKEKMRFAQSNPQENALTFLIFGREGPVQERVRMLVASNDEPDDCPYEDSYDCALDQMTKDLEDGPTKTAKKDALLFMHLMEETSDDQGEIARKGIVKNVATGAKGGVIIEKKGKYAAMKWTTEEYIEKKKEGLYEKMMTVTVVEGYGPDKPRRHSLVVPPWLKKEEVDKIREEIEKK